MFIAVNLKSTILSKETLKKYQLEANIVSALYNQSLKEQKVKIKDLSKITIELVEREGTFQIVDYSQVNRVCQITRSFDFVSYMERNYLGRCKIILEATDRSLTDLSHHYGWELQPFTTASQYVISKNFINKFIVWEKYFSSKDKRYKAAVEFDWQPEYAMITIIFTDKDNNIVKRIEVEKIQPIEPIFGKIIAKAKWLNNTEFAILNFTGDIAYIASVESNKARLELNTEKIPKEEIMKMIDFYRYISGSKSTN